MEFSTSAETGSFFGALRAGNLPGVSMVEVRSPRSFIGYDASKYPFRECPECKSTRICSTVALLNIFWNLFLFIFLIIGYFKQRSDSAEASACRIFEYLLRGLEGFFIPQPLCVKYRLNFAEPIHSLVVAVRILNLVNGIYECRKYY